MLKKISSYIIVLGIGAGLGTYFNQKHTIEEKVVYKDRIKTEIKEIITERPDGTKVTERVIEKDEKKDTVATKKESIPVKSDWAVGVSYELFGNVSSIQVDVNRRILGNLYIRAYGRSQPVGVAGGVGLLYTF